MDKYIEIDLENIPVMCITQHDGVKNAGKAFTKLESKLPTLMQRKFYGCLIGDKELGIYKACVKVVKGDNPVMMNLELWTIPKGKYIKTKIMNWNNNLSLIGKTTKEMSRASEVDTERPVIEFYKSQKELILYLPIV